LKALGVKGILIKAAKQGYITQLACKMPECFCPEELGAACYFEPVTDELSPPVPKCTRLVPATNRNLATTGNKTSPFAGFLCKPSDGLEPSTPSLPFQAR
jgi:hypothetical protein